MANALDQAATGDAFSAAQRERLSALAAFWRTLDPHQGVARLLEQAGCFVSEARGLPQAAAGDERLHQLALHAAAHEDKLAEFLESTALQSDADFYDQRADRVSLMTLHAAKGLEFPVIFVVGCEEGLLPYERPGKAADIEEERRLFYVGMTRAQHKLVLTSARTRFLFGQRVENRPSRFVDDIEAALIEIQALQHHSARKKPGNTQLSLF